MTITSALNYINTSIKTAFANAIKVLSSNVYKVKFPDVQKISGVVKTDTADGFNRIVKKIEETKQLFGQKGIQVNNFPKIPTKIEVSNFPVEKELDLSGLEKKITELNESIKKLPTDFPEFPKFPEIKIPAQKEIKFPEYPKFPEIPKPEKIVFPKSFSIDNAELLKSNDPKAYIPVRLTDGKEFYKAIEEFYQQVSSSVTFTNSKNQKTSALVDEDRHVQVDVLTAPPVTVDTSEIESNQTDGSQKTRIVETLPDDSTKLNPSLSCTRNASGYITVLTMVADGVTKTKTITRDVNNYWTDIGEWT